MDTLISPSAAETEALGKSWGQVASAGWLIGLVGDLGAGKTQWVKGLARGLGVHERIHSPTFALVNEYRSGRCPLFHLDLYRLRTVAEVASAGLEEYFFQTEGVTVVEWFDHWLADACGNHAHPSGPFAPGVTLRLVRFTVLNETERQITYEDFGA